MGAVKYNVSGERKESLCIGLTKAQREWVDSEAASQGVSRASVISNIINKAMEGK